MRITNSTALRNNLFNTLDSVIEYNESVIVNARNGNAVILSEEDYNSMMETIYIYIYIISKPNLLKMIKDGKNENIEDMSLYDQTKDLCEKS